MSFLPKSKTGKIISFAFALFIIFGIAVPTVNLWTRYYNRMNGDDHISQFSRKYNAEIKEQFPSVIKIYGTTADDYQMKVLFRDDLDKDKFVNWANGIDHKFKISFHKI